ncbi:MAG: OsmC family protein [Candidatus Omnitrophica bacterium]|nr:OsmC family protein [Candidatus Omnitrophota bacterium]MCB9720176.1 OsmC family protein [Candidatus Omnitrophota bacterium]
MKSTTDQETVINGVNVSQLGQTVDAVKGDPGLAKFRFHCTNRWINGGHNRSTIQSFYGAGREHTERPQFVMDCGEPPVLLGSDEGANPVEYILNALAGCMTTTMIYHAAARGIKLESVESELQGELDLQGFLQLKDDIRKGYQLVTVKFKVKSDASAEQLEELARNSPVFDIVTNPVPVNVHVEKI